jgi:hypothetical protein
MPDYTPYSGYEDQSQQGSYAEQYDGQQFPDQQPYQPGIPQSGTLPYPNQSSEFLKFLFNFRKEVTIPLRHLWRGHEIGEDGNWETGNTSRPLMNERGITWSISIIESYINPVYIVSNYSEEDLNWTMRQLGRVVYNNLCPRYKEFGLNKLDIQRVANEIISKVHAILLGARNNGYRMFLSSTHTTTEYSNTVSQQPQRGGGIMAPVKNFFMR